MCVCGAYFTREEDFRMGARAGGNQNFVVWAKKHLMHHEVPNDIIVRENGSWQGGVSVVVRLGLCFRAKGSPTLHQRGIGRTRQYTWI